MFAVFSLALASPPPSSTLTGDTGTLSWTVEERDGAIHVEGRSPKWAVRHVANADLTPRRTERVADGETVVVTYTGMGAEVTLPSGKVVQHRRAGIWDGDTLDVRLGFLYAAGDAEAEFHAIDTSSGKAYHFDSTLVGVESCGATTCGHVRVQLTGLLRWAGPTFHYWYAPDGQLLRFSGPAGDFEQ